MHICGVDLQLCTEAFMVSETPGRIQTKHSVEGGAAPNVAMLPSSSKLTNMIIVLLLPTGLKPSARLSAVSQKAHLTCRDVRQVHAAPVEPTCLLQEACDVTGGTPSLRIMFLFDKNPPVLDSIIIQSDVPAVD